MKTFISSILGGLLGAAVFQILFTFSPVIAEDFHEEIYAKKFILEGQDGKVRGIWTTTEEGTAALIMIRPDGKTLSGQFLVMPSGSGNFVLFDEAGKTNWMAR